MPQNLTIIKWPDPRLLTRSLPVDLGDSTLPALATEMIRLMHEARGVGLAAPQVGLNLRLFVANPTGEPGADEVFMNPELTPLDGGSETGEEGCLSLPGITVEVLRDRRIALKATGLDGKVIDRVGEDHEARVWQHENDHLDGILLLDRMGPLAKMAARRTLKEMQENYASLTPTATARRSR